MLVGHNTEYLPDLKAKVEIAPESPETDGLYLMKRENGLNSYYPFSGGAGVTYPTEQEIKNIIWE